jgi:hypothetical protein
MLQITKSRVYFDESKTEIVELTERYFCTMCGSEGSYIYDEGKKTEMVRGDVEQTDDQPRVSP